MGSRPREGEQPRGRAAASPAAQSGAGSRHLPRHVGFPAPVSGAEQSSSPCAGNRCRLWLSPRGPACRQGQGRAVPQPCPHSGDTRLLQPPLPRRRVTRPPAWGGGRPTPCHCALLFIEVERDSCYCWTVTPTPRKPGGGGRSNRARSTRVGWGTTTPAAAAGRGRAWLGKCVADMDLRPAGSLPRPCLKAIS